MSGNLPQFSDLSIYHNRIEIIQDTANQIIKDFEQFDEKISFSGNPKTAYVELCNQVVIIVTRLIDENFELLLSLLYRIDIEEKKVTQASNRNFPMVITELIIERELKKVVTRHHFKNKI